MNTPSDHWADDSSFDFRESAAVLWGKRWWIVGTLLLFSLSFGLVGLLTTPTYRSSTVLVPANSDRAGLGGSLGSMLGSLGGLASVAGVEIGGGNAVSDEALAVLRSREFTESFIRDMNLMTAIYASNWDPVANGWKRGMRRQPTIAKACEYFNSRILSVFQDKKTNLITIQIDWRDRFVAAQWANALVQRLNEEMRRRALAKADASLGFLQKELGETAVVETRDAISRSMEAQINQRMLANITKEYAFRVVDHAFAADEGEVVKPHTAVLLLIGSLLGLMIGSGVVLLANRNTKVN